MEDYGIPAPVVSDEMTVGEARLVIEYLALSLPFIGRSQDVQLKGEALSFVGLRQG
jgi:hypothetical protein